MDHDTAEAIKNLLIWHNKGVRQLELIANAKPGTRFEFDENVLHPLESDGFRMGVKLALMLLGKLPLQFEFEDEEE